MFSHAAEEIGVKTAYSYKHLRDDVLALIPIKELNLKECSVEQLAQKVAAEPFAGFSPVPVDEAAALKLLTETLG